MTRVFPLETERLSIDVLGPADIDAFVAYRRHPEVARYQAWDADYPRARAETLVAEQVGRDMPAPGEWVQLALHRTTDRALLGDIAVHKLDDQPDTYEIGCTLDPAAQRTGYAVEAARAVVDRLFSMCGAHRVIAGCDVRNTSSIAALQRLGLRRESRLIEADWCKGEWTTVDAYAVLAREWAV